MARTAVGYFINLTNAAQAQALQAQYPAGIQIPPAQAAAQYGLSLATYDGRMLGFPPTSYNTPGFVTIPSAVGTIPTDYYDTELWNCGFDFYWVGLFIYTSPANTSILLGARYWVDGFEIPTAGEGSTSQGQQISRDASRTSDGMGFCYRGPVSGTFRQHALPVTQPATMGERLYIRIRALPSGGEDSFWFCKGSLEGGGESAILTIDTSGNLKAYNCGNSVYPGTLLATYGPLAVGVWYKLDVYTHYRVSPETVGHFTLWINDNKVIDADASGNGLGVATQLHATSHVGCSVFQVTNHGMEMDLDDWIGTQSSGVGVMGTGIGLGSHVQLVRATGFGAGISPAWTGDYRSMCAFPFPSTVDASVLMTIGANQAGALLELSSDYVKVQKGCPALVTGIIGVTGADASALLGTNAGQVLVSVGVGTWISALHTVGNGTSADAIPDLGTVTQRVTKGTNLAATWRGLLTAAESIGVFGQEDATGFAFPPFKGIHNAPYPLITEQNQVTSPLYTVSVEAGTYTGNNIGQDVFANYPGHWFWVRNAGSTTISVWYSSMSASHEVLSEDLDSGRMPQALMIGSRPAYRITGSQAATNASATTYQWVAVSDPAMIYMLNGAFAHKSTLGSATNALIDPAFTPEGLFLFVEAFTTSTAHQYFKGLGHGTNTASVLNAAVSANIATLAAGSIGSLTAIHTDVPQTAFSAWRRTQPGGVQTTLLDLVTWTGDGTGNRNITCHLGGFTPAFALATPHNAASIMRDPSHTGTNSLTIGGANTTTGIIGFSANTVQVGASLNALGIVYDLFVLRLGTETGLRASGAPYTLPSGGTPVFNPTSNSSGCRDTHNPTPTS